MSGKPRRDTRFIIGSLTETGEIKLYIGPGEAPAGPAWDVRKGDKPRTVEVFENAHITLDFEEFGTWLAEMAGWWAAERRQREELDGDIGTRWRIIGTDTESNSGVAPVCPRPEIHSTIGAGLDDGNVYDGCCAAAGPHLQCWTEDAAREVAAMLNRLGVEVCD